MKVESESVENSQQAVELRRSLASLDFAKQTRADPCHRCNLLLGKAEVGSTLTDLGTEVLRILDSTAHLPAREDSKQISLK